MRLLILTIYLLSAIIFQSFQILGYQWWYPRMIWAVNTLQLDFAAQRALYLECKRGVRM